MANIIFGLISLALGLWGVSVWWWSIVEVLRGVVPVLLILLGFVALGAGVTRMRDQNIVPNDSDELSE
nr:magnetosome protein MamI [uncultured bacterium]